MELFYFKNERQKEVDFVIKEHFKVKSLIQVCWNIEDFKTKKREIDGLVAGLQTFNLKEGLVITDDYENEEYYKEFKIRYIPLYKWLLKNPKPVSFMGL